MSLKSNTRFHNPFIIIDNCAITQCFDCKNWNEQIMDDMVNNAMCDHKIEHLWKMRAMSSVDIPHDDLPEKSL